MADFEEINRLIRIKVNEAYEKGHKEGMEFRKEITEGLKKEEYQRGYNEGKEALILASTEYQRGYKAALESKEAIALASKCDSLNEALERGRREAWDLGKKIFNLPCKTAEQLFHTAYFPEIFLKFSVSEVMEKIKAYEEKQKQDAPETNVESIENRDKIVKAIAGLLAAYGEQLWDVAADMQKGEKNAD